VSCSYSMYIPSSAKQLRSEFVYEFLAQLGSLCQNFYTNLRLNSGAQVRNCMQFPKSAICLPFVHTILVTKLLSLFRFLSLAHLLSSFILLSLKPFFSSKFHPSYYSTCTTACKTARRSSGSISISVRLFSWFCPLFTKMGLEKSLLLRV